MNTERIATLRAGIETLLDDARADRDRLHAENARLQRVVDDLADALRQANAEVWAMAHGYDFPEGGKQVSSAGVKKRAIAIGRRISASLIKHVLLRPCDDPAQVPSAMRAEVE